MFCVKNRTKMRLNNVELNDFLENLSRIDQLFDQLFVVVDSETNHLW